MKLDIKLYIDDKLVDFSNDLQISFTYSLKDVNNPTIVKNPFTKTINIIGTPNNNKIFGAIYKFDREQIYDATKLVGAYFNPSVRTPFTIYRNGELIENGYMQLNSITLKGRVINYNVTLYGGIGNYLYSLMYSENGEALTLSDLTYNVKDSTGKVINSEDEFNFTMSKEFVWNCWNGLDSNNNGTIYDFITFMPSYNGLPQNFDSDKVLINTYNNSYWDGSKEATVDGVKYTPYNNYVLATLPRKFTEWEILDLRSYLQRPAIKMSKIIEACSNPINNGGYNVELDTDFFNNNNPYYKDAWVALPLLSNKEKETQTSFSVDGKLYNNAKLQLGNVGGANVGITNGYVIPVSNFNVTNNMLDYTNTPIGTTTDVEFSFKLDFTADTNVNAEELYLCFDQTMPQPRGVGYSPHKSAVVVQLVVTDDKDNLIAYSDAYSFASTVDKIIYDADNEMTSSGVQRWEYYWKDSYNYTVYNEPIVTTNGKFINKGNRKFSFVDDDKNSDIFKVSYANIPYNEKLKLKLKVQRTLGKSGYKPFFDYNNLCAKKGFLASEYDNYKVTGGFNIEITDIKITRNEPETSVSTNTPINKKLLLKTEKTPADYLLSYTKLFNLFYTIDETTKTIKIQTIDNYFKSNIVDWDNKIDYSKDIVIKPLMFDKKFYCMKQDGENFFLNKYKNEYSIEYGQKRINTNYNFNADTQQLFDGNVFQNAVSVTDTSAYYHTFVDKNGKQQTPFNNSNYTYNLFKVTSPDVVEKTEVDYTTPSIVGAWSWNKYNGYDSFPKTCFYNIEGDEKSLSDINSTLVFYNGKIIPKDFNGKNIRYKLSDDVPEMYVLNDKKPCYLYSDYDYTQDNKIITYDCTSLPQFLRYKISANQIQASWDFGKPKELYIPDVTYDETKTIYNQYWGKYYQDQLDINTKEVTCYVNLNDEIVNSDLLRNFYYFNGSYWLLNRIENYDVNKFETSKCTFIKVNNILNYKKNFDIGEV